MSGSCLDFVPLAIMDSVPWVLLLDVDICSYVKPATTEDWLNSICLGEKTLFPNTNADSLRQTLIPQMLIP